ncbi:MAG: DUF302 domain-containing protein [Acidobacteriota bacterium]|nr:DUF302 domain-containing protein [Acidobacteriota bacterium]
MKTPSIPPPREIAPHEGLDTVISNYSVDETVARLLTLIDEKGIKLFCLINHSSEAAAAGLTMRPTRLLILGNPAAGTPVMVDAPSAAIDLPLKLLVTETEEGKTLIFWNDPEWLAKRHAFSERLAGNLAAAALLAQAAAT